MPDLVSFGSKLEILQWSYLKALGRDGQKDVFRQDAEAKSCQANSACSSPLAECKPSPSVAVEVRPFAFTAPVQQTFELA